MVFVAHDQAVVVAQLETLAVKGEKYNNGIYKWTNYLGHGAICAKGLSIYSDVGDDGKCEGI